MAITYPLALPTTTDFLRVTLRMGSVVAMSESAFSRVQQVQVHPGEHWRAGVTLVPMERADAEAWLAFLGKLNGREGTFLLGDPAAGTPRGSVAGSPQVDGASQTGGVLSTKGWTASATGVLLPGDYIQLGSGEQTRLYKVLNQVDADGSGLATIDIWPDLRESPADSEALVTTDATGTFRLASNVSELDLNAALHYGLGFESVEAI